MTAFVTILMMLFSIMVPYSFADGRDEIQPWDGEEVTEPEQQDGVYQIGTGAELAWFRDMVNSSSGSTDKAVLLADIDLGENKWTPIGSDYSNRFQGEFSGDGHTVSGMKCEPGNNKQAGLFGYVSGAKLTGVTISGEVTASNSSAGGLVSRTQGSTLISECGNLAKVTNSYSSGKTAGIAGWAEDSTEIKNCFNRGDITSGDRASGIVADTGTSVKVTDCYNTGAISGNKANGIGSATGIRYLNCYNAGQLTGNTSSYGIGASNFADYVNTYYLSGTASNAVSADPAPVELPALDMKKASFAETLGSSWKVDAGGKVNGGFPLLSWEPSEESGTVKLDTPDGLSWCEQENPDPDNFDIVSESCKVRWNSVEGADAYMVRLYRKDGDSADLVFTGDEVAESEYDLFSYFSDDYASKTGEYVFTVTCAGDGVSYEDSDESEYSESYVFDGRAFVPAPSRLRWNEASKIAVWEAVPDADHYIVTLFKGEKEIVETKLDKKVIGNNTGSLSAYFLNNITGSGKYYFTVRAGKTVDDQDSPNHGKTAGSALAVSEEMESQGAQGDAISITSAEQWIDIVNMEAAGTEYVTDADRQKVEWSKNYVLDEDLDFSGLDLENQSKTKSWGNIDVHFSGTLDGQGHKITGLTLSDGDAGLFNYIGKNAVVKNITVVNANLLVSDNAAVFAHYNYGTIQNCHVRNTNITTDYAGVIGPMASRNMGTISGCSVQGGKLVARTGTSNGHSGFVGNNTGTVKRCWTSMSVSTESSNAGGFVGWSDEQYAASEDGETVEKKYGTFEDCFSTGDVYARKGWSGGFVGRVNSSENTFTNCYAAGEVTSEERPERCYGFVGSYGSEGFADINDTEPMFNIDPDEEKYINCFYLSDKTASDNPKNSIEGKTFDEMRSDDFTAALGLGWMKDASRNSGLPYLSDMPAPEEEHVERMTVEVAIATYDRESYEFARDGEVLSVSMDTTGNTCVTDVMDEAEKQGLLTYEYKITPAYGSFIESINGNALSSPDGWMFTVNDTLSNVSASITKLEDGDQLLWYQGTTQNLFAPPSWQEITGEKPKIEWTDIRSADDVIALASDDADLSGHFRLLKDIDLSEVDFNGIGAYGHEFSGTFDGNGHKIKNVTINRPEDHNIGFFNFVRGAVIKDLTLENVDITGKYSVGGFIGVADAEVDLTDRTKSIGNNIGNCHVSGTVTSVNEDQSATSNGSYAGGFVGFNNGETDDKTKISVYSSIDRCTCDVHVTSGSFYTGGFAGGNYGYITFSGARGEVDGTRFTGGFTGGNEGGIYDSYETGDVRGREYTGGFTGTSNGAIERCYCTGDVSGTGERVGGFIGSGSSRIISSASAGKVTAPSSCEYTGGFAGHYEGSYTGMEYQITFRDNYGWCVTDNGVLAAIGNKKSSTYASEQSVLESTCVSEWVDMQDVFSRLFGLVLTDDGDVIVPERDIDLDKLAETLYRSLDNGGSITSQTPWVLADIAAYEKVAGSTGGVSPERKQEFIDHVAASLQEKNSHGDLQITPGDLAKYIIALKALGADPQDLRYKGEGPEKACDLTEMLRSMVQGAEFRKTGLFTQPYILIALSQDEGYADDKEIGNMIDVMLSEQLPQGGFGGADAAGPVVMALSLYTDREDVREAIENTLSPEAVVGAMDNNGAMTYNGEASSESTAQMLTALAAAGKDIELYKKQESTLEDGLKVFVNEEENGFYHNYSMTGNPEISNEQGFRGLLALKAMKDGGRMIYDFRDTEVSPAVSGVDREQSEEVPEEDTEEFRRYLDILLLKKHLSMNASGISYSGSAARKAITLKWKKVAEASVYVIKWRKAGEAGWKTKETSNNKMKLSGLVKNRLYEVKVSASAEKHGEKVTGASSQTKYIFLSDCKVRKAKAGRKKLVLKFSKAKKASGYKVEYSLNRNMKKAKAKYVAGAKRTKATLSGLKKGKRYYVRVTPVRKRSGKTYTGIPGKVRKTGRIR